MPVTNASVTVPHSGRTESPGRILVVDDEPQIRLPLQRYLYRLGHEVDVAEHVPEALGILAAGNYDLVITDLRLPGASGIDLIVELRSRWPATRAILISANADVPSAQKAIEAGVDSLVVKPFDLDGIRSAVEGSLSRRRAQEREEVSRGALEAELARRRNDSRVLVVNAALSLVAATEAKDAYTAGHARRVRDYAMIIRERIGGIDPISFQLAGDLHDIGKIGIPDHVLNKPDRLTEEEYALVKRHPADGVRILEPLIDDPLVKGVVLWHHERWDGRGYPDGLAGEQIPLAARILAVADTFDAITSHRAYRDGLPFAFAVAEIRRCAGAQFDAGVVAVFDEVLPALEDLYRRSVSPSTPSEGEE